jgi:predicted nucleic acid-binding protein
MSAVTVGELRSGIDLLPHGMRRSNYQSWLNTLVNRMEGRILSFNTSVAVVWGQMLAKCRSEGRNLPAIDSQIAATAKRHSLTLATRNENDFRYAGVKVLNPFRV